MVEKKILQHEEITVDKETGEVLTTVKNYSIKITQDEFYMTYIENMSGFFKLRSAIDIKLITMFCKIAEYNTGKVILSPKLREEIMGIIGLKNKQQMTNSIANLKKLGLLKGERGTFFINPLIFWKGKNDTRNALLKGNGSLKVTLEFGYSQ